MKAERLSVPQGARTERVVAYERGLSDATREGATLLSPEKLSARDRRYPGYRKGYRYGRQLRRSRGAL